MVLDDVTEYEITPTGRKEVNFASDLYKECFSYVQLTQSLELIVVN